eukprot:scpid108827/ scgid8918/ 
MPDSILQRTLSPAQKELVISNSEQQQISISCSCCAISLIGIIIAHVKQSAENLNHTTDDNKVVLIKRSHVHLHPGREGTHGGPPPAEIIQPQIDDLTLTG